MVCGTFAPDPADGGRGLALILQSVPLKRVKPEVGKKQRHICFPPGEEESNPPPKPVPPSPSGLIYSDFLRLHPLLGLFPAIPRCCSVWLDQSFRQNGEGAGFPWENMPWDAIRAKNMWPLSSTLISQNKTQGFLPSGVSDQQEKGKSTNLWLGLKHFLARSPALSWRKLPGLWGLQRARGWLLLDSLGSAHPRLPHILI